MGLWEGLAKRRGRSAAGRGSTSAPTCGSDLRQGDRRLVVRNQPLPRRVAAGADPACAVVVAVVVVVRVVRVWMDGMCVQVCVDGWDVRAGVCGWMGGRVMVVAG